MTYLEARKFGNIAGFAIVKRFSFCYNRVNKYTCTDMAYATVPAGYLSNTAEKPHHNFVCCNKKEELLCAVTVRVRRVIFLC